MVTSPSRGEVISACRELVRVEERIHALLADEENLNLDEIERFIEKQQTLIEEINSDPELKERLVELDDSPVGELLDKFESMRAKTTEAFRQQMDELETRIEGLEDSGRLLKHYLQGDKRDEETPSLRIDENA